MTKEIFNYKIVSMKKVIYVLLVVMTVVSCQKQLPVQKLPPTDMAIEDPSIDAMRKSPTHGNPHDNPPPPPPPVTAKKGCILIDADGHNVSALWSAVPFQVNASGLTATQIAAVVARVQYDYAFENDILVTLDEAVYNSFPENKRIRVVATTSWEWYGYYGGVAIIGSFNWYGEKECFVFTPLLQYNQKYVSDAVSHEAYHTFGGRHNATWDQNCNKVNDYLVGDLIPGNCYASPAPYFGVAANDISCTTIEDAKAVIRNSINQ
jgi:hypothetical protein